MHIRPYEPGDVAQLRRICILTGAAGQDATGLYRKPEMLHVIWLDPYLAYAPHLCQVAEDDQGVVGYWIGVGDAAEFEAWREANYWPAMRELYPVAECEPGSRDAWLASIIATPAQPLSPGLAPYPAELHIDILPRGQGQGTGRALMTAGLAALRAAGVPGVHLGVATENTGAIAFYRRLGFEPYGAEGEGLMFVMDLTTQGLPSGPGR